MLGSSSLHFRIIQLLCGTGTILEQRVGEAGKFVGKVISLHETGVFLRTLLHCRLHKMK